MIDPKYPTPEELVRLSVRACRVAVRFIGGPTYKEDKEEVARRIQEVWEDEGIDISSLATCHYPGSNDADVYMREVYRARKGLPEEVQCRYCGERIEKLKAYDGCFCNSKCSLDHDDFLTRHPEAEQY